MTDVNVFHDDGQVVVHLPSEELSLALTPVSARLLAAALYTKAAHAEGLEAPGMVLLPGN